MATKKKEINIDAGDIIMKRKELDVTIRDIYGGDGEIRYHEIEKQNLRRTKTTSKSKIHIKDEDGNPMMIPRTSTEIVTEIIHEPVKTFKCNEAGLPTLALGHKIRGTLKAIGVNYARMEHPVFPSITFVKDIMSMISVSPALVVVSNDKNWRENGNYSLEQSPQIMNTAGKSMITQYFDSIKKLDTKITIVYPSTFEAQVSAMVKLLPSVKTLNRRAATIEIKSIHDH